MTLVPSSSVEPVPAPRLVVNICLTLELISIGFFAGILGSSHPRDFTFFSLLLCFRSERAWLLMNIFRRKGLHAILLPLHNLPQNFHHCHYQQQINPSDSQTTLVKLQGCFSLMWRWLKILRLLLIWSPHPYAKPWSTQACSHTWICGIPPKFPSLKHCWTSYSSFKSQSRSKKTDPMSG